MLIQTLDLLCLTRSTNRCNEYLRPVAYTAAAITLPARSNVLDELSLVAQTLRDSRFALFTNANEVIAIKSCTQLGLVASAKINSDHVSREGVASKRIFHVIYCGNIFYEMGPSSLFVEVFTILMTSRMTVIRDTRCSSLIRSEQVCDERCIYCAPQSWMHIVSIIAWHHK